MPIVLFQPLATPAAAPAAVLVYGRAVADVIAAQEHVSAVAYAIDHAEAVADSRGSGSVADVHGHATDMTTPHGRKGRII